MCLTCIAKVLEALRDGTGTLIPDDLLVRHKGTFSGVVQLERTVAGQTRSQALYCNRLKSWNLLPSS